jgi:predicted RNase H-like HicB family nuclease
MNEYLVTLAIEDGNDNTAWGVVCPDLPGCYSAGDTLAEALANARDAVLLYVEDQLERGESLPAPRPIEQWKASRKFAARRWTWSVLSVDLAELQGPAERVNVMIPRRALTRIDAAAKRAGKSRSAYLVDAALAGK